jgi:hypothetical protein
MKNKRLLFNLMAVLTGIAILTLSATGTFNNQSAFSVTPDGDGFESSLEYLAMLKNNQVTGTINPADILKAKQLSLKAGGLGQGIEWTNAGPDNFGGRTRALLFDNQDPEYKTIYAASTSGGLWKSVTEGILWDFIPGTESIINVTSMVQDPEGKIFVGTGETFTVFKFAEYPGFMGNGIHVSTDGVNFEVIESTIPEVNDTTSNWAYINRLAINPDNNEKLYAANHNGLKFTADGGATWNFAKTVDDEDLAGSCIDVKVGSDGTTITAINGVPYLSQSGDPMAFDTIATGVNGLPRTGVARWEFAIAPSNPDFIYAVATRSTINIGQLLNVYQSKDRGITWRVVGPGGSSVFNLFGANNVGEYASIIVVHPSNPEVILVGGRNLWKGTKINEDGFFEWKNMFGIGSAPWFINSNHHVYAFKPDNPNTLLIGTDRGIYRSVNNLASFANLNKNYSTVQSYSVAYNSGKRILTGTQSNGVLFISESGNTERQATRVDQNLNQNGANVVMSVINQDALIWSLGKPQAGSASAMPIFRSDDLGQTVSLRDFHPATTTIKNLLPPMLYWESTNFPQSRDSLTFTAIEPLEAGEEVWVRSQSSRYPFKYTLPVDMEEGDTLRVKDIVASRIFYGMQRTNTVFEVYMTKDALRFANDVVWYKILLPRGYPQSMGVSKDGNQLWVGTRNGKLYRLGNLHNAYNAETAAITIGNTTNPNPDYVIDTLTINFPEIANRIITSIFVDPQDPDHVIVTLGNYGNDVYVYRSTNATSANPTFTSAQGNLPKMPVYSSLIEMNHPEVVILGTERGIWTTGNINNPTWTKESGTMGDVAVFQIKQQTSNKSTLIVPIPGDTINVDIFPGVDNYGKIYAATFGRGIYKTTRFVGIGELPETNKISQARLHVYPNPASQEIFIGYNFGKSAQVEVSIIDLNGRIIQRKDFGMLSSGQHTLNMDISSLKHGIYLVQLTNGDQALSNKLIVR